MVLSSGRKGGYAVLDKDEIAESVLNREQALEHLAAVVSYLRSCSKAEAKPSALRCLDLWAAWMEPAETWQEPSLSLLDAKNYSGSIEESGAVYGLCPHHLVPYYGNFTLQFQPESFIVGLSSIGRAVDRFCRRALLQESLTQELGEFFYQRLNPKSLEICISARHFCKEMQPLRHSSCKEDFVTRWHRTKRPENF